MSDTTDIVVIDLVDTDEYQRSNYDKTHTGLVRHRVTGANLHNPSFPHRVQVWTNVNRPNPHPGERKWTEFGSIGGDGRYLDPRHQGTDDETTVYLSSESISILASYTEQDIAERREGPALAIGEHVQLRYPDGHLSGVYEIVNQRFSDPILVPVDAS